MKETRLVTWGCTIEYTRNPGYWVFTNESQKTGKDLIFDFPWKKKDIFKEAEQIMADRYFDGDLSRCRRAITITKLIKETYPPVICEK